MLELKKVLALLESYFHGTSSGFDPLSSYLKFPILIQGKDQISMVGIPRNRNYGKAGIFLVNTGFPRKTGELVELFMRKTTENNKFTHSLKEQYIPWNNHCIESLISGNVKEFVRNLMALSRFQLVEFSEMIPANFVNLWERGISEKSFFMKLCGAGGGGFLLGFAGDLSKALEQLTNAGIETVTVYRSEPA
jgi:mevalonate kinase